MNKKLLLSLPLILTACYVQDSTLMKPARYDYDGIYSHEDIKTIIEEREAKAQPKTVYTSTNLAGDGVVIPKTSGRGLGDPLAVFPVVDTSKTEIVSVDESYELQTQTTTDGEKILTTTESTIEIIPMTQKPTPQDEQTINEILDVIEVEEIPDENGKTTIQTSQTIINPQSEPTQITQIIPSNKPSQSAEREKMDKTQKEYLPFEDK